MLYFAIIDCNLNNYLAKGRLHVLDKHLQRCALFTETRRFFQNFNQTSNASSRSSSAPVSTKFLAKSNSIKCRFYGMQGSLCISVDPLLPLFRHLYTCRFSVLIHHTIPTRMIRHVRGKTFLIRLVHHKCILSLYNRFEFICRRLGAL